MTRNKLRMVAVCTLLTTLPFVASAAGIQNPLNPNISSIPQFISTFLKVMVTIALPVVGFFLLYSGFLFIKAQGRTGSDGLDGAKENFKYVIIGSALMLGAWVLATLIGNTVTQIVGPSVGGY
jgi:hypothetical protein